MQVTSKDFLTGDFERLTFFYYRRLVNSCLMRLHVFTLLPKILEQLQMLATFLESRHL